MTRFAKWYAGALILGECALIGWLVPNEVLVQLGGVFLLIGLVILTTWAVVTLLTR